MSPGNVVPHLSVYKIEHDEAFPLSLELMKEGGLFAVDNKVGVHVSA